MLFQSICMYLLVIKDVMLVQAVHDIRGPAPTLSEMLFLKLSAGNNLDGNFPCKSEMHNIHVNMN